MGRGSGGEQSSERTCSRANGAATWRLAAVGPEPPDRRHRPATGRWRDDRRGAAAAISRRWCRHVDSAPPAARSETPRAAGRSALPDSAALFMIFSRKAVMDGAGLPRRFWLGGAARRAAAHCGRIGCSEPRWTVAARLERPMSPAIWAGVVPRYGRAEV